MGLNEAMKADFSLICSRERIGIPRSITYTGQDMYLVYVRNSEDE